MTIIVYYNQSEKEADGSTKISASILGLDIDYKISDSFSVREGIEIISGNSQTDPSTKKEAFNPFYGTNHKFNGFMDYFYVGSHTGMASPGLQNFFLNFKYLPKKFNA